MSRAKVDRYKEEKKRTEKKSWQKEKKNPYLCFYNLPCLIWLMQSSAPESRFVT